jgi:Arc/MetJ-type ribon-helix-helix transcriptional regulator
MAALGLASSFINDGDDPGQYALATLQYARAGSQRSHDQELARTTLQVKEAEQTGNSRPEPHDPPRSRIIILKRIPPSSRNSIVEPRQETLFAIGEQFIERAPRHPRTGDYVCDDDVARTALSADLEQRREQTRTLNLDNTPVPSRMLTPTSTPIPTRYPQTGKLTHNTITPAS